MVKIVGVSGSLRKKSYNSALLHATSELMPEDSTLDVCSIKGIPLYDGDLEENGNVPPAVGELKDKIADSNGLFIVTPEYNNSMPGVLKNAVDWLSRPYDDIPRVFNNRPVGLIGATPGRMGTVLAQTAWLPVFRALGMVPWCGEQLYVSDVDECFDQSGILVDEKMRSRLKNYMLGFVEFIKTLES